MAKEKLRQAVLNELWSLDSAQRQLWQDSLEKQFFASFNFEKVKRVAIYYSFFPEIDTHRIIELLNKSGVQTCLPCLQPERQMSFAKYHYKDPVECIWHKVYQPQNKIWVAAQDIDLMVVPGLVFSEKGQRIGFGGGYYDRYLEKNTSIPTLALAFPCQISNQVDGLSQTHDQKIDLVISPK